MRRPVRLACAASPSFLGLLDDSVTDFGTTQLVYFGNTRVVDMGDVTMVKNTVSKGTMRPPFHRFFRSA